METNNETVEQVCECVEYLGGTDGGGLEIFGEYISSIRLANRILDAHKRELADFQRRYDECVRKFNEAGIERVRLRDEVVSLRALVKEITEILKIVNDGEVAE